MVYSQFLIIITSNFHKICLQKTSTEHLCLTAIRDKCMKGMYLQLSIVSNGNSRDSSLKLKSLSIPFNKIKTDNDFLK